jgi:hypothetical protein
MSDFITTRAGRVAVLAGTHSVWWALCGVLWAAGHAGPWMALGLATHPALLLHLTDARHLWAGLLGRLLTAGAVTFWTAALIWPNRQHAWVVLLAVPILAGLVIVARGLPHTYDLSPELDPGAPGGTRDSRDTGDIAGQRVTGWESVTTQPVTEPQLPLDAGEVEAR